jgi:quinol monooxygenase YgiN
MFWDDAPSYREMHMLCVVATIKVKPGSEQDFESVAKQLVAKVNANEPGCKLYALHKGDTPLTYVFVERYVDEEAAKTHRGTDHFKDLGRKMGAFMDGAPAILRLNEI